jgi:hypothetical protein
MRMAAWRWSDLASLTAESEFFGLLGSGHPDSFYKVYVRRTKDSRRGWCFEVDAAVVDPCERTGLDRTSRHPRATAPDRTTLWLVGVPRQFVQKRHGWRRRSSHGRTPPRAMRSSLRTQVQVAAAGAPRAAARSLRSSRGHELLS